MDFVFALVLVKYTIILTALSLEIPIHCPRFLPTAISILKHPHRCLQTSFLLFPFIQLVRSSLQEHWHYFLLQNRRTFGQINSHLSKVILSDGLPFLLSFLLEERTSLRGLLAALTQRYGTCQFVPLEEGNFLLGVFFIP